VTVMRAKNVATSVQSRYKLHRRCIVYLYSVMCLRPLNGPHFFNTDNAFL